MSKFKRPQVYGQEVPPLPCPECRVRGVTGKARIGNDKRRCTTCNNFARNVYRITSNKLRAAHAGEFEELRLRTELDLYPQVLEEWDA